ncbi:MAG TPA: globin domain-containing protein [Polyangiaceae bacterium]|jgi:hemoglobin-like flavoprotein|nr:globin domain-containing protein [Polyangiaceae bacterium]
MLKESDRRLVRSSFRLVVPIADTAADLFYKRLFELKPEYKMLFVGDIAAQKRKLVRMLAFIVKSLDYGDAQWRDDVPPEQDLMLVVLALGRRHTELYRIPNESYAVVAEALLWTLDYGLGEAFTAEVRSAWTRLYTLLAQTMRLGTAAVDRNAALGGAASADRNGEEALLVHLADAGIDEARLRTEEPS